MSLFFLCKDNFFIWQQINNYSSRIYRYTLDNFVLTLNYLWEFATIWFFAKKPFWQWKEKQGN